MPASASRSTTSPPDRSKRRRPNSDVRVRAAATSPTPSSGPRRPVFITGGVTPETVPGLAAAGARCFVVVRYLTESDDPRVAARALRRAIDAAVDAGVEDEIKP